MKKKIVKLRKKWIAFILAMTMVVSVKGISVLSEAVTVKAAEREMPKNPVHHCTNENGGSDTTDWSYVYFGSYPQTEVTGNALTAAITGASYDANGDAWVNGTKYRRMKKSDANYSSSSSNYFPWNGENDYHYFKWERIKWRVLNVNGSTMFVAADKGLDCKDYHDPGGSIIWENCTLRRWLNNDFYRIAFSSGEQRAVVSQTVVNEDHPDFNTEGGNDTTDKVYLLSLSEVMNPDYGFCENNNIYVGAMSRLAKVSDYAHARGAATGYTNKYRSNCYWWLRSPANRTDYAMVVDTDGTADCYGRSDSHSIACVPALHINLSSDLWSIADDGSSGEEIDNIPRASVVSTTACLNVGEKENGEAELICDETMFAENATDYQHHLAKFAMGLSTLVYNTKERCTYITNAMKDLGYTVNDNIVSTTKDPEGLTAPFFFASKTVNLNGEKTNIVFVVIRGTYQKEWIDNFDSGEETFTHKGFQRGCDYVYGNLNDYIEENHLNDNNIKILVTGHSRGAAVANLLGAKLDDEGIQAANLSNEDIFVYTFATPNTTSLGKGGEKYHNIYNIVNPEDFVTKVMPSAWGYSRRGVTYVLPSRSTDPRFIKKDNYVAYEVYLWNLKKLYKQYKPESEGYKPYSDGMESVSNYVEFITGTVPSNLMYYRKILNRQYNFSTLKSLYTYTLGYYKSGDDFYKKASGAAMIDAACGVFGTVGQETVKYFAVHQVLKADFECAHTPEMYLAAMNILTEEELKQTRKRMKGIVNCPVDITVKDSSGEVMGQIINNEVIQSSENEVVMDVKGDSKSFTLPQGVEYTVELSGNDNGFMDYSICEMDADTGEVSRTYYQNVPISQDTTYTQEITGGETTDSVELKDETNQIVESSGTLTENEVGQLSVDVAVEGIGSANGFENLSPGDYVSLEAIADENNRFLGWYDIDGNLVCEDAIYGFSIQENKSFTAKFTNVVVDCANIQFEEDSVIMKTGETYVNTAKVFPENATYKSIQYTSSNPEVVQAEAYGLLTAVKEGTATITAASEDGKVSSVMTVTVDNTSANQNNQKPGNGGSSVKNPNQNYSYDSRPGNVKLKKAKSRKKGELKLQWKRTSSDGYQLQYALNKKFTKGSKMKTLNGRKTGITLKKLKSKKKYFVRIRAYRENNYGGRVYGAWSSVKNCKVK